jgi:GT2 family glycosyltransferase
MPLSFSVVIPLHNKRPHILRALRSALAQPEAVEIIVVDDASSDGGMEELAALDDKAGRIIPLRRTEPGPGGYAARNLGASHATASWVAFLDADDEWLPDHLGNLASLAEDHPEAAMLASGFLDQRPGQPRRPDRHSRAFAPLGRHAIGAEDYLRRSAQGRCPVWTSAMAVSRSALLVVGGFPEGRAVRGGDQETWLRLVLAGNHLAWSPQPTAIYHRDATNMVTTGSPPQLEQNCIWQTIDAELRSPRLPPVLLRQLSNRKVGEALFHRLRNGTLHLADLRWLYPGATPLMYAFFALACGIPRPVCRRFL